MLTTNPIDQLTAAFDDRALRIIRRVPPNYPNVPITQYLKRFLKLHEKHVGCLRNGQFLSAYAHLVAIRDLSQRLERAEYGLNPDLKRRGLSLRLRPGSFTKGRIVCGYLTGEITPYSRRYRAFFETTQGKIAWPRLTGFFMGLLPRGGRERAAIAFYERIVADLAPASCEEGRIREHALVLERDPAEEPSVL